MTSHLSLVIEYPPDAKPLRPALDQLVLGGRVIKASVGARLMKPDPSDSGVQALLDGLSPQERMVLNGVLNGKKAKEIGLAMGISHKTVNSYRYRIHRHFCVRSDVQLLKVLMAAKVNDSQPEGATP